jgi:hypothetical protein
VGFTAAAKDESVKQAVDATASRTKAVKLASVWITSVNLEQPPTQDGSTLVTK